MTGVRDVVVLNGPSVNVDRHTLERYLAAWGDTAGVSLVTVWQPTGIALAEAVEQISDRVDGLLVNPGAARDLSALIAAVTATRLPTVWVDLAEAERSPPDYATDYRVTMIRGRGVDGYRWALRRLIQLSTWPSVAVSFGPSRDQLGDLRLPDHGAGPHAVVVLFHGGFWRERWERDTIEPLAIDLARRGFASLNLEYRRVGPSGGGWPATCGDAAAGVDALCELASRHSLDLDRVCLLGHSAGAQLALWLAQRRGVEPRRRARVEPALIVSLAGITDLVEAAYRGLGDTGDAVAAFMGAEPEEASGRYDDASPRALLPLGVEMLVVQGLRDSPDLVDLSASFARAASCAGDEVQLLEIADADHFDVIDPDSQAWHCTAEAIERTLAPNGLPDRLDSQASS